MEETLIYVRVAEDPAPHKRRPSLQDRRQVCDLDRIGRCTLKLFGMRGYRREVASLRGPESGNSPGDSGPAQAKFPHFGCVSPLVSETAASTGA